MNYEQMVLGKFPNATVNPYCGRWTIYRKDDRGPLAFGYGDTKELAWKDALETAARMEEFEKNAG